jgi:hypothetical protein
MKTKHILIIALIFVASAAFGQNLVKNPGFEDINGTVPNPLVHCNHNSTWGGGTPAANWASWVNVSGPNNCMMIEVVKQGTMCIPILNKQAGNMMHVITVDGVSSSVAFNPIVPEYKTVKVSCWIYVVKGKVGIGAGNAGNSGISAWTSGTCKWEYLETTNSVSPANNLVIGTNEASEWYIDDVSVIKK